MELKKKKKECTIVCIICVEPFPNTLPSNQLNFLPTGGQTALPSQSSANKWPLEYLVNMYCRDLRLRYGGGGVELELCRLEVTGTS